MKNLFAMVLVLTFLNFVYLKCFLYSILMLLFSYYFQVGIKNPNIMVCTHGKITSKFCIYKRCNTRTMFQNIPKNNLAEILMIHGRDI